MTRGCTICTTLGCNCHTTTYRPAIKDRAVTFSNGDAVSIPVFVLMIRPALIYGAPARIISILSS